MGAMAFIQTVAGKGGPLGTLIIVLLIFLFFFKTFFVIVHRGQIGVVMLRGNPARRGDVFGPLSDAMRWFFRKLKIPGMEKIERVPGEQRIKRAGSIVFRIPGLGMVKIISTMDKRNALDEAGFNVEVPGEDGPILVPWEIFGDAVWHIREDTMQVIDAMFNADELSEIVVSTLSSAIGAVYEEGLIERENYRNNERALDLVLRKCSSLLLSYGVSVKRLNLRNVREVPVQIRPLSEAIRHSSAAGLGAEVAAAITTAFGPRPLAS